LHQRDSIFGDATTESLAWPSARVKFVSFKPERVAHIQQQQNIRREMLDTSDLLRRAVFQNQYLIRLRRGIVVAAGVGSEPRADALLR
jgi:hypothetical protein